MKDGDGDRGGDSDSVAYTDDALAESKGIRTTGWQRIPAECNDRVTLQTANARVTAVTLELAVRNEI